MKLLIRSANHKQSDFTMPVEDNIKSVLDIKQYLSQNYPDKPDVSFMRMIFQGHLLANEKLVSDIFPIGEDCYVVHLVCLPRIKTDSAPTNSVPTQNNVAANAAPATSASAPVASAAPAGTNNVPPANAATQPIWTNIPTPQPTSPIDSQQFAVPRATPNAAFTEWYASYYSAWFAYLAAMQAQAAVGVPNAEVLRFQNQFSAHVRPAAVPRGPLAAEGAVAPENGQAAEPAAPAQAPDNRGINAAAGPLFDEDDEEGHARDLIDWIYVAVRAGILLSLIYLYSSIPRIVALIAMLGSVWLLRAALGGLQHNNNNQQAQQQADRQQQENAAQQQAPQNPENGETPAAAAAEANPTPPATEQANNNGNNQPVAARPPAPVPTYRLVFSAIAGFFLSLFPDAPGLQHLD